MCPHTVPAFVPSLPHRLWRRLPAESRRQVLARVTGWLVPGPDTGSVEPGIACRPPSDLRDCVAETRFAMLPPEPASKTVIVHPGRSARLKRAERVSMVRQPSRLG